MKRNRTGTMVLFAMLLALLFAGCSDKHSQEKQIASATSAEFTNTDTLTLHEPFAPTLIDTATNKEKNTTLVLKAPPKRHTKGAIRGVRISFIVYANMPNSHFELVSPPKGMRIKQTIRGESCLTPPLLWGESGAWIVWDVPMDAKEGKVYTVTVKASDPNGNSKTLTFPVKVPKTIPIQTELRSNELIVTDKDSPLYGMKLKGHNGEDVSKVRLRSVRYEDVWRKRVKRESAQDKVEHIVFVIDNMPEALDVKMPEWMGSIEKVLKIGARFVKNNEYSAILSGDFWEGAVERWDESSGSLVVTFKNENFPEKTTKIFMIVIEKSQNKGK